MSESVRAAAHHPAEATVPAHRRRPSPGPVGGSLHRFAKRVPALKAMALEPIGDIASPSLSDLASATLTWETATDWDNAVSEDGVAHESTANTDHDDATVVKMGFPYASFDLITPNPIHVWPFHEDSGTTANDLAGNNDGSLSGPTVDVAGLLGTTAYDFDGTDDGVSFSTVADIGKNNDFTVSAWFEADSLNQNDMLVNHQKDGNDRFGLGVSRNNNNEIAAGLYNGSSRVGASADFSNTGVWTHVAAVYDSAHSINVYIDGTVGGNNDAAQDAGGSGFRVGERIDGALNWDGRIGEVRLYNQKLTSTQISTLSDVVNAASTLTTATKTFASTQQPDLQNLSYSLNGESITLDIIGSPGEAGEETVSQALDGSTSYTLTWAASHTDFRVKINHSTTDEETTPTLNKVELVGS